MVEMLQTTPASAITTEAVLETSGISRSSLYHHFADFSDLIEAAEVVRFSQFVDRSLELLESALEARTSAELRTALLHVTRQTQARAFQPIRLLRLQALAKAAQSERFAAVLGAEQERLTQAITDIVREVQGRGLVNPSMDPRAAAVLIQAYTIGRAVDDITPEHMTASAWLDVIDQVMDRVFLATD